MSKITSIDALRACFTVDQTARAIDKLVAHQGPLTDKPVWMVREQCRMDSGEYTAITLHGDDPLHFLHVSTDDSTMVAYTKNAEKGAADVQTRTTLQAYKDKFGLSDSATPAAVPQSLAQDLADLQAKFDDLNMRYITVCATARDYLELKADVVAAKHALQDVLAA